MEIISFYLPQFHEIPENNDAWGHGFTEWTNVKKSRPLFAGHRQPRVPLHGNYYDLLDSGTLKWQTELAAAYGVDCFCFYHYWFHGRMVLERPVEGLRRMPGLPIHYCFAWANEPWTKTWHGAGGGKEILIAQDYGKEEEWEAHYQYFLPYFRDGRYLKKQNRPVLLIYKLQNIPFYNDMIRYWKRRALEDGFAGIYLLCMKGGRNHVHKSRYVDGTVDFEPNNTKSARLEEAGKRLAPVDAKTLIRNRVAMKSIAYKAINEEMLKTPHQANEYRTVFVDYDDTPRRGSRGVVTFGSSPELFGRYLRRGLMAAQREGQEFFFLNAWNEWGEGNYLEPDTKNRYGYLNAVRSAKSILGADASGHSD